MNYLQHYIYQKRCENKCEHPLVGGQCEKPCEKPCEHPLVDGKCKTAMCSTSRKMPRGLRAHLLTFLDFSSTLKFRSLCKDFYITTEIESQKFLFLYQNDNLSVNEQEAQKEKLNKILEWISYNPLFPGTLFQRLYLMNYAAFDACCSTIQNISEAESNKNFVLHLDIEKNTIKKFLDLFLNNIESNSKLRPNLRPLTFPSLQELYFKLDEHYFDDEDDSPSEGTFNALVVVDKLLPVFTNLIKCFTDAYNSGAVRDSDNAYASFLPKDKSLKLDRFDISEELMNRNNGFQFSNIENLSFNFDDAFDDVWELHSRYTIPLALKIVDLFFPALKTLTLDHACMHAESMGKKSFETYVGALKNYENLTVETLILTEIWLSEEEVDDNFITKLENLMKFCIFISRFRNVKNIMLHFNKYYYDKNAEHHFLEKLKDLYQEGSLKNLVSIKVYEEKTFLNDLETSKFQEINFQGKKRKRDSTEEN